MTLICIYIGVVGSLSGAVAMYVCICRAVTEGEIKAALDEGIRTMRELRQGLGVASECGKCGRCALRLLRQVEAQAPLVQALNVH
jgi:bacterioferritin-associated ferredoxin